MRLQTAYLPTGWRVAGRSWTVICVPIACQRRLRLPYLAFHPRRRVFLMLAASYAILILHLPMILMAVTIPKVSPFIYELQIYRVLQNVSLTFHMHGLLFFIQR